MKNLTYLLFASLLLFASCAEDDDDNNNNINTNTNNNNNNSNNNNTNNNNNNNNNNCGGSGSMFITFDGVNSTQTAFNNTLLYASQGGEEGFRLDLRTNVNGGTLVLSISDWLMHNPPVDGVKEKSYSTADVGVGMECTDQNGYTYCDGALGTFITNASVTYMTFDENHPGYIDIDECDAVDHIVSGSFNLFLTEFGGEDSLEVSGTFTDLCYTVLN